MCGVVGVLNHDGGAVDPQLLRRMALVLRHRGPDDEGFWTAPGIGLGHRRLSIIDLGGSAQPMSSVDDRFHISFNGEIFNYVELRRSLDYPFRTRGDTEVVLALYAAEGTAGLTRLRGQFAFAIHDRQENSVVLVRDRLGVLPMYYLREDDRTLFASEVKALHAIAAQPPKLEVEAVREFLLRRAVPAPATLYAGVSKVPPGHVLRIEAGGALHLDPYWTLPGPADVARLSAPQAVEAVDRALRSAVEDALVADVPVGSYLSGGVDSSLIVALASRARGSSAQTSPMHTYCAAFGDPRHDETHHARAVSDLFGTNHHEVPVRARDFEDLWPRLTRSRDAPLSEPADVAVFLLAERAREDVKVVLSGEGSDELFGGYPKYRFARATAAAGLVPNLVRQPLLSGLQHALPAGQTRARTALRALSAPTAAARMATWFAPFTLPEIDALMGEPPRTYASPPPHRDAADLMARMDLASWLPDNLLERGDRMTMASSVELRPPFLDHRLVELAVRLPTHLKVRRGETKWLVKQVASRYLPQTITGRRKIGFKVPLDDWLRVGLRDLSRELLLSRDSLAAQLFDQRQIAALLDSHESTRRNEESRIWTLLSLEQWSRTCLAGDVMDDCGSRVLGRE